MSANHKFPKLVEATIDAEGNVWGWYSPIAVDAWLQRCIEDKPKVTLVKGNHRMIPSHEYWEHWFKKWFGQFLVPSKQSQNSVNTETFGENRKTEASQTAKVYKAERKLEGAPLPSTPTPTGLLDFEDYDESINPDYDSLPRTKIEEIN